MDTNISVDLKTMLGLIGSIGILAGGFIAWGVYRQKLSTAEKEQEKLAGEISGLKIEIRTMEKDIKKEIEDKMKTVDTLKLDIVELKGQLNTMNERSINRDTSINNIAAMLQRINERIK